MSDFWSRRRAAVEAEDRAHEAAAQSAIAAAEEARLVERDDAELLEEAGLPDPDTLETSEQVQAFLRSALPQRLKQRALRRLWRMNPVLACLDGLNDYDGDFTDAAHVRADLQTAYQVGRGILREIVAGPLPETVAGAEVEPEPGPEEATEQAPLLAAVPDTEPGGSEPQTEVAQTPRRMRFSFETDPRTT